jgi:hypothetical protein
VGFKLEWQAAATEDKHKAGMHRSQACRVDGNGSCPPAHVAELQKQSRPLRDGHAANHDLHVHPCLPLLSCPHRDLNTGAEVTPTTLRGKGQGIKPL